MTIQTRIQLGRNATDAEKAEILVKIDEAIAAGTTDGTSTRENDNDPALRVVIRTWTTLDAANNWVSFSETFNPQPLVAEVVDVV